MSSLKGMLGGTGAKADAGKRKPSRRRCSCNRPWDRRFTVRCHRRRRPIEGALNVVWEVQESKESGLWHFARNYVLSFAAVLALGFLLLVSLLVTAGLAAAGIFVSPYMPEGILHLVSLLVSFAVVAVLFAMMFKWLPDVSVAWGDVWLGALLTALFFELGKAAIGFYIGKQGLESTYGAAASIVAVLIWGLLYVASHPDGRRNHPRLISVIIIRQLKFTPLRARLLQRAILFRHRNPGPIQSLVGPNKGASSGEKTKEARRSLS